MFLFIPPVYCCLPLRHPRSPESWVQAGPPPENRNALWYRSLLFTSWFFPSVSGPALPRPGPKFLFGQAGFWQNRCFTVSCLSWWPACLCSSSHIFRLSRSDIVLVFPQFQTLPPLKAQREIQVYRRFKSTNYLMSAVFRCKISSKKESEGKTLLQLNSEMCLLPKL